MLLTEYNYIIYITEVYLHYVGQEFTVAGIRIYYLKIVL